MARFDFEATARKSIVYVKLTDPSGRIVARGRGKTVPEAQQDAKENATNEDAKLYLQQVLFPNRLTRRRRTKKPGGR